MPHECEAFFLLFFNSVYILRFDIINLSHNLKIYNVKAVKRNFLVNEEYIRLNEINYFQVGRYFNPSHFNLEDKLNLHFDCSEGLGAEYIRILAVYIDTSKSIEIYEGLEFTEEFKLPFPEREITKKVELSVSLKLKEDTKLLWKIAIQIRPDADTLIHLTVS